MTRPVSVVLAGGGSAGHVSPLLATADALRRIAPDTVVTALGTSRGLEASLVPARGYPLELVPRVPMPRKPTPALLRLPGRLRGAVAAAAAVLDRVSADVVVGFGGYVSAPAYLAARRRGTPIVVHEANPRPGLANRLGARFAVRVATATDGVPLAGARTVGLPLRREVATLDRAARRLEGRYAFGLDPDRPTLLVTGGSQGARTLNTAALGAAAALAAAGVQVLHAAGPRNTVPPPVLPPGSPPYVLLPYLDRMELAYAAADLVLCRSGANTCAELTAVGLPGAYVPLPHGNGEQRMLAEPVVAAGGGLLVDDAACTPEWVAATLVPVLADPAALAAMGKAAAGLGHRDADLVLARLVLEAAGVPV
ncbi:MAG TPA: UDP-N-acetylglucosamine--N-acetylmuramyl-(pentapeptide) pyrophosphoryl-undecaprenol N-acetylglucosamine transferase [Mycobacteriales bacterium]|nr:UDP-N-acetylglucosamine--N-acetylmuramyl-(pentapeptide) pyrophosphoryl-undecaprenol N-acetylglucosamine transferase [Mycobacteriales bacterium]